MFKKTLTAECDTEGCQASVALDIDNELAANKLLAANGWAVTVSLEHPTRHVCPWCCEKQKEEGLRGQ